MASGTIYGTTSNQYIESKIEWSSVADVANNRSTVTAALYYRRTNTEYMTYGTGSFALYIANSLVVQNKSKYIQIESDWVKALECSDTVYHHSDGTMSVEIRGVGKIDGTTLTATYCSATVDLDTIPRETTLDSVSCSTQYLTGLVTVKYTPKHYALFNQCDIVLLTGDDSNRKLTTVKSIKIGRKDATQQTATVTLSEREFLIIYNKITNDSKATLRFYIKTYTDPEYTTISGSGTYKEITLNIPNNQATQPTVSMELSPSSDLPSPYNSLYLQGHSKVKASLTSSAKYGATIVSSVVTVEGKNYESPYESVKLSQAGTVSVKATVKDSRGFYGTYYKEIEVIPYSNPYVTAKSGETSIIAARCDSSANFTESGTYLKIKAKAVVSKVISGSKQLNYGFIKFRYRKEGGSYSAWTTILDCKANNSDEVITPPLLDGKLDIKYNYQVQIIVSDDFYDSVPIIIAVPSGAAYMDRPAGGKSMGLGGYSSGDGNLDVYWKTMARGGLSLFDAKGDEIPLDSTMPLPRNQVAAGWNPDDLDSGVYVVANSVGIPTSNGGLLFRNGVLIQMHGDARDNVRVQLAIPVDSTYNGADCNPMYRIKWYSSWTDWRNFKR